MNEKNAAETEIPWDAYPAAGTRKSFIFNGVEFTFRYCPPGTFQMGTAWDRRATPRQVTLSSGFWLAETPTTQAQYVALTGTNPSFFSAQERNRAWEGKPILNALRRYLDATGGDASRLPVETVSWEDAQDFCNALNDAVSLPPGLAFRLPWEAEWEYACRAGTSTAFYWGAEFDLTRANARQAGPLDELKARRAASPVLAGLRIVPIGPVDRVGPENAEACWNRTTEVGRFGANAWGLCDIIGNVWEWVGDRVDYRLDAPVSSEPRIDPKGDRRGGRGMRGGAWNSIRRSSDWSQRVQDHCAPTVGFRVAVGRWDAESAAAISEPLDEAAVAAVVASIRTARENAPLPDPLDANSDAAWDSEPPAGTRKTFDVGGVEFAFRYYPPGTFIQGETSPRGYENPGDRRITTLSIGFWLAETPTTQAQYEALIGENPSFFSPLRLERRTEKKRAEREERLARLAKSSPEYAAQVRAEDDGEDARIAALDPLETRDFPVETVSCNDAANCAQKATEAAALPDGFVLRLPTEAEWERACRAGTTGPLYADEKITKLAWIWRNGKRPRKVGGRAPNPWAFAICWGTF